MSEERNWAGNYEFRAARWHSPETVEQLQEVVARSSKVRALGTRHSFNAIADTTEDMVSLQHFDRVVALDRERRTVTVGAGIRYGQLGAYLHQQGYALHNMASLPHISVAGACATATHGSGDTSGNLATAVCALEMVLADGEVQAFSRAKDGDMFDGMVVGLGGIGVVTQLTLEIVPTYEMRQDLYENLPLAQLEAHFDAIETSAYSVCLFTDWQAPKFNQAWLKSRVPDNAPLPVEWYGATPATTPLHPIPGAGAEPCTEQMGCIGPWHERLPHFRMNFTPSSGEELQAEYIVPREHACAALRALYGLHEQVAPLLQISEVRTIAADTLWMSPCYRQAGVALHFTWKKDWPAVAQLLPVIEAQLTPFDARPHWGKLFTMRPERLQSLYPKLPDFRDLLHAHDPQGKFCNAFLDTYLFGSDGKDI